MTGGRVIYATKAADCRICEVKAQRTTTRTGRTVRYHIRQDIHSEMYTIGRSRKALQDLRTRQRLMERSFAQGVCFGMKDAPMATAMASADPGIPYCYGPEYPHPLQGNERKVPGDRQ
jgi:hypothetical protein